MSNRKTYQLTEDGARKLVTEQSFNNAGELVSSKTYAQGTVSEKTFEYNKRGQTILEKESEDGIENSRLESEFDSEGRLLRSCLYVGGELYEEVVLKITDKGTIEEKMQSGDLIERTTTAADGLHYAIEFLDNGEIFNKIIANFDSERSHWGMLVYDQQDQLIAARIQHLDDAGNEIKFEERDSKGVVIVSRISKYGNGELVFQERRDYEGQVQTEYIFDNHGNLIGVETRDPSGNLTAFEKYEYDKDHQLIAESGFTAGSFDAVYGTGMEGDRYELVHEYE